MMPEDVSFREPMVTVSGCEGIGLSGLCNLSVSEVTEALFLVVATLPHSLIKIDWN